MSEPFADQEPWRDREYLGDGVYAAHDGFQVWICVSNGVHHSAKIALEPKTLANLLFYARRVGIIDE